VHFAVVCPGIAIKLMIKLMFSRACLSPTQQTND